MPGASRRSTSVAIAGVGCGRYERRVQILLAVAALVLSAAWGCESFPPVLSGVTIAPADAAGTPQDEVMARTRLQPPIPLIALKPGADPSQSGPFLNQGDGAVAITLARGTQNFLLLTAMDGSAGSHVVAVFLENEPTPALSGVVSGDPSRPVAASTARTLMGLEGEPVENRSALSVVRGGYRVLLRRAAFPLSINWLDLIGPWSYTPDHVSDKVGLITLEVQRVAHGE